MKSPIKNKFVKIKYLIAAVLTALLIIPSLILPAIAADVGLNLQISEDKSGGTPILTAGTKALIRLPFVSYSFYNGMMYNVKSTISGPSGDPLQFSLNSAYQNINYISFNTLTYLDYEIDVPITAVPGMHSITLTLNYDAYQNVPEETTDENGNLSYSMKQYSYTSQSTTLTYNYTIINDDYDTIVNGNPIRVTGSISPDSVKTGDVFNVGVSLANDVAAAISGVSVTITPPTGFMLLNDASSKTVSLAANGTADVIFNISATDEIKSGSQQFTVTLAYSNPGGKSFSVQYYMVVNASGNDTDNVDKNPAKVEITSIALPSSAAAGGEFTAVVTLTNTSDKNAVIDELAVTNTLGILNRTNAVLTGMKLAAGESRSYEIKYFVPENTATAYANFSVSLKYTTEGGSTQHTASISGGMMISSLASPSLSVSLTADPAVKVNGTVKVTAVVKNSGGDATNVAVSVTPATGMVPKSQNKLIVSKLASGASYTCTFELLASESAADGYNLIGIDVVCGDISITQYTGTDVDNPKKADTGTTKPDMPVIIIDSYDYGDNVYAGTPFTLTMTFKNTSQTAAIKEMKLVIQSEDGTFTPTSSSNTFFVETLAAGASITKQIELAAKTDAKPLSFPISIVITYKNSAGDSGTSTEEITIPVQQELRFNKGALTEIGTITTADSGYLTVSASNLGMSTIRNVRFSITGDGFSPTETEFFAGTMEPGNQASHEFELVPSQAGSMTGTVTYTYEDTKGQTYTETQTFTFEVTDSVQVIDPGMPIDSGNVDTGMSGDGTTQSFFSQYQWYIVGGAVILGVIITVIIIVVVRRRKKNEDDDY
jgi:hypothetical protein